MRTTSIALIILAVFGFGPATWAQTDDPLVIARVRGDGLLVPFASTADSSWVAVRWNAGRTNVRLPEEWYFTGADGTRRLVRCTSAVRVFETHVAGHDEWGYLTDNGCRSLSSAKSPIRTVGVATTNDLPVEPFAPVARWDYLRDVTLGAIRDVLDSTATAYLSDLRQMETFEEVQPRSLVAELAAARLGDDDAYLVHVFCEIVVGYDSRDPGCGRRAALNGWVSVKQHESRLLRHSAFATDCDFKAPDSFEPHALIRVGATKYVFGTQFGWESAVQFLWRWSSLGLEPVTVNLE